MITKGNVEIGHAQSDTFDVWGKTVKLKKVLDFAIMKIDGETVMSETPQEVGAMKEDAKGIKGRVLVAGLGLGIILQYLRKNCTIHVVEPNKNVIAAYGEFRRGDRQYDFLHEMTIEDFLDSPKSGKSQKFDFVYLDTWYGLDPEYLPHINWMREKARPLLHPGGIARAWGYDRMTRGFVRDCMSLVTEKRKQTLDAHPENIKRLSIVLPLLGAFAKWFRAHPKADPMKIQAKAIGLAMVAQRCPVPLNIYLEYLKIKESHYGFETFKRLLASEHPPTEIVIGGQKWKLA